MKNKTTVKIRKILSLLSLLTMIIVMGGTNPIDANEERGGDILKKFYSVRNESFQQEFEEESKVKDKYVEAVKTLENEFNNVEEIDYYSGCYINDENKFVVATNNKKQLKSEGVEADIYNEVEFSYKELQNTYNELNILCDKNKNKFKTDENNVLNNLSGFYISVQNNKVVVEVYNMKQEESLETIMEAVTNTECIEIVEVDKSEEQASTLKLGQQIFICRTDKKSGNYVSIGIKAYYINGNGDKVHGFITAGHGTEEKGEYVYLTSNVSNKAIGQVVKRKVSGKVDAAFVKITNSNYTISRQAYYSDSKGNTSNCPTLSYKVYTSLYEGAIGETVYKVGYKTYLTKGKLKSNSATKVSESSSTGTIKDMYKSSYKASSGDSGGTVYYHDSDGNQYLGIHQGRVTCSDGTEEAYAVKWENIDDVWTIYFEK